MIGRVAAETEAAGELKFTESLRLCKSFVSAFDLPLVEYYRGLRVAAETLGRWTASESLT